MKYWIELITQTIGILCACAFISVIAYIILNPVIIWAINNVKEARRRKIASFTVWIKDAGMTPSSIESVRDTLNKRIIIASLKVTDIISVTHSPHIEGHQFTIWYKVKPADIESWWKRWLGWIPRLCKEFLGRSNYYDTSYNNYDQNSLKRKLP